MRAVSQDPGVISEPRSLAELAYQKLVQMITRLDITPGSLLVEKDLMEDLGIGRTPIREALQRLSIEGLVIHQRNRGMFVAEITTTAVQNIYEFRSLIDGHLVRLAAQRATNDQHEELQSLPGELQQAISQDDIDAYIELDRQFYYGLTEAAQNIYLAEVTQRIFNLHLRLWFYISSRRGGWRDVAGHHLQMVTDVTKAIVRRDPEEAELAIKVYISQRHQDMRDLL